MPEVESPVVPMYVASLDCFSRSLYALNTSHKAFNGTASNLSKSVFFKRPVRWKDFLDITKLELTTALKNLADSQDRYENVKKRLDEILSSIVKNT